MVEDTDVGVVIYGFVLRTALRSSLIREQRTENYTNWKGMEVTVLLALLLHDFGTPAYVVCIYLHVYR